MKNFASDCDKAYSQALTMACRDLDVCNPLRLSLVLNVAVFQYEIQQKPAVAMTLAVVSIAQALEKIDDTPDKQYVES